MKKIYLLTLGLVAFVGAAFAQPSTCTGTGFTPVAYWYSNNVATPPYCKLVFVGGPTGEGPDGPGGNPSGFISVRTAGGVLIPALVSGQTFFPIATDGSAEFNYDCSFTPARVFIDYYDVNGNVLTCDAPVVSGGTLPVKLTSFTGRLENDNQVTLDWASSMEFENSRYEVERSVDGKYFEKVGTLNGSGSTNNFNRYTFNDRIPGSGAYFYRLKQIDYDGVFEYSKVVYVNSKKGAGVITKIFPNPFKGEVQLIGATSSDLTPNNVQVFNIAGQRVTYRFMGANSILIDPSAPDGIYMLRVKGLTYKLVKSQASGTGY